MTPAVWTFGEAAGWDRATSIEHALRLAELGFGIVPVHHPIDATTCSCPKGAGCTSIGKHPVGDDWPGRAEHDPVRVRTMLGNPGNRAYGIVPPDGVFAWDVDGGVPARLESLAQELGPLPPTRVHRSGEGTHRFYRWPSTVPDRGGNHLGIVTRRSPGGMVVGPGSVHASTGRLYGIDADVPIAELPLAWAHAASDRTGGPAPDAGEPGWTVPEGERHAFLVSTCGRLRNMGLGGDALEAALQAVNLERCVPPQTADEVAAIAAWFAARDDGHGPGPDGWADEEPAPADGTPTPVEPPALAHRRDIVDLACDAVAAAGHVGERRAVGLIYLVVVTRLLDRIVSVAVKGPSSAGKSHLVEAVLDLFPASAAYSLSAMSERALVYDDEPLAHRMLVIYEASGMAGDMQTYLIRTLLSEGRLSYVTVEKTKAGMRKRRIDREGPTGLITTTTEIRLHPENETRLVSIPVSDTPDQTKRILLAHAAGSGPTPDRTEWQRLQAWLEGMPSRVDIPYAVTLADMIPPVAVRLRRDFPVVLSLVRANALLHRLTRDSTEDGVVVASIDDYRVVRGLMADLVADAAERAVSPTVRETVAVVARLTDGGGETTVIRVAAELGLDKSAALRRVRATTTAGYVQNLETGRGRPARLVLGDPLPADQVILPEPDELARLHGCSEVGGDIEEEASGAADAAGDAAPTGPDPSPDPEQPANDDGWPGDEPPPWHQAGLWGDGSEEAA